MRRLIAPILLSIALCGCTSLRESAHSAIAFDGALTAAGVGSGVAVEANPLIGSPLAFGGLLVARFVGVELANQLQEPARTHALAGINSMTWGVVVSNALIIVAASNPVGLVAGAMVGLGWWKSTEHQREFSSLCASERLANPRLQCTFNGKDLL